MYLRNAHAGLVRKGPKDLAARCAGGVGDKGKLPEKGRVSVSWIKTFVDCEIQVSVVCQIWKTCNDVIVCLTAASPRSSAQCRQSEYLRDGISKDKKLK